MATAVDTAPASGFYERLWSPRVIIALLLIMWLPLVVYVMFGNWLGTLAPTSCCRPSRRR